MQAHQTNKESSLPITLNSCGSMSIGRVETILTSNPWYIVKSDGEYLGMYTYNSDINSDTDFGLCSLINESGSTTARSFNYYVDCNIYGIIRAYMYDPTTYDTVRFSIDSTTENSFESFFESSSELGGGLVTAFKNHIDAITFATIRKKF